MRKKIALMKYLEANVLIPSLDENDDDDKNPKSIPHLEIFRKYSGTAKSIVSLHGKNIEEALSQASEGDDNDRICGEICDLSVLRKLDPITIPLSPKVQIEITPCESSRERWMLVAIISIAILSDEGKILLPFVLSRTGTLLLCNTQLPIENFLPEEQCKAFREIAFTRIFENLRSKSDDFPDLLIGIPESDEAGPVGEIRDETHVIAQDAIENPNIVETERVVSPPPSVINKKKCRGNLNRLHNLGFRDLARMLPPLLDGNPPVQQRHGSSHWFFTNKCGVRLPIPFHKEEPVGIGLLISVLKRWGIFKEFCEQL